MRKGIFRELSRLRCREDPARPLLPFDRALHDQVVEARDTVMAHSDFSGFMFERVRTGPSEVETKIRDPFGYLSLDQARKLLENAQSLRAQVGHYQQEASAELGRCGK